MNDLRKCDFSLHQCALVLPNASSVYFPKKEVLTFLFLRQSGLEQFYNLSSNYYYGAGAAVTVVVGLIATAITGNAYVSW